MNAWWTGARHAILPMGIPLSWRQLSIERRRLAAAVAGIAFAAVMMQMQLGFHDALYRSATLFHSQLAGELIVLSSQYDSLISSSSFPERRLYQALSVSEVESAAPILLGAATWKNPVTGTGRSIFVIGIDPAKRSFWSPGIETSLNELKQRDVVLFDAESRPEFGPVARLLNETGGVTTELSGHRIRVGGSYRMGTGFAADGALLTSDFTFVEAIGGRPAGVVDLGILKLKPGADVLKTRAAVLAIMPADVRVLTKDELIKSEIRYWANRTPIGFVIGAGMLIGFVVGAVIVYQILYTDVTDHLPEYATLKALGFGDRTLYGIVLQQAVILSVLGFLPATLMAGAIFSATRKFAMLPAWLTWDRTLIVFLMTLGMCALAGAFATRRLRAADPAEIF